MGEKCAACTLARKGCKTVCMRGRGPTGKWMIVGEAPGEKEDERGLPFVGPSGKFLRALLKDAHIPGKDVFFTNAIRCRPPNNADPTTKQLLACWPHLEAEIEAVAPERIILAGGAALRSVLGVSGINKLANEPVRWNGVPVLPVLHPAALLRILREKSHFEIRETIEAMRRFSTATRGRVPTAPTVMVTASYTVFRSGVMAFFPSKHFKPDPLVVDVETTGFDWTRDTLRTVAVAHGGSAVVLTDCRKSMPDLLGLLLKTGMVGHNLKFDLHFLFRAVLAEAGPKAYQRLLKELVESAGKLHDTMVAAHWLDSEQPKGLKTLAYIYTDRGGYDRAVKDDEGHFNVDVDLDVLARYNGMDAVVTGELWQKLKAHMPPWYRKTIMPLLAELTVMEERGLPVDVDWLKRLDTTYAAKVMRATVKCRRLTGRKDFNPGSLLQVREALLKLNWRPKRTTPKGAPQLREEDLEELELPLADAIRDFRKASKMRSTYAVSLLEQVRDGQLHPSFNLTGTKTGRLSSSDPNFQNVPRGGEVRGVLCPGKGWRVVEADFAQAELRVLAWYSKDDRLMRAARDGEDLHTITAQEIFRVKKPTSEQRQAAKSVNFALMYGEGPAGLANQIGCSIEEANRYIEAYFDRFPGVRNWHQAVWNRVGETRATENAFGLHRWFKWWGTEIKETKLHLERAAVNTPVQGTASELTSLAFIRYCADLRKRYNGATVRPYPVALVHDSILVVAPAKVAKQEGKALAAAMASTSDVLGNAVRMDADVKITARWGEEKGE